MYFFNFLRFPQKNWLRFLKLLRGPLALRESEGVLLYVSLETVILAWIALTVALFSLIRSTRELMSWNIWREESYKQLGVFFYIILRWIFLISPCGCLQMD